MVAHLRDRPLQGIRQHHTGGPRCSRRVRWGCRQQEKDKPMSEKVQDPFGLCVSLSRKFFLPLWKEFREDVLQECHCLALEHEWYPSLKEFSRYIARDLYKMATNYDFHRPRGSKSVTPRQFWDLWQISEEAGAVTNRLKKSGFMQDAIDRITREDLGIALIEATQ